MDETAVSDATGAQALSARTRRAVAERRLIALMLSVPVLS
jgi:hypothetical protein